MSLVMDIHVCNFCAFLTLFPILLPLMLVLVIVISLRLRLLFLAILCRCVHIFLVTCPFLDLVSFIGCEWGWCVVYKVFFFVVLVG